MANPPSLILKQYDTWPPWNLMLSDANGPIDLTNAAAVDIIMVGTKTNTVVQGSATVTQVEFTATASTSNNSNVLSAVSSFAGLAVGQTLNASELGIPAGTTIIELLLGSEQIVMSKDATVSATGTAIANQGAVAYTPASGATSVVDVYAIEVAVHWTAGGVMKIPNAAASNPTVEIDGDLTGAPE